MRKILNIEIKTLLLIIFQVLIYAFVSQVFASGEIKGVVLDGSVYFNQVYGAVNAERFPAYHRMDLRVARFFNLPKGRLSTFLEFRNLYNRKNVRLFYNDLYVYENGNYQVVRNQEDWLPLLPSTGISWEF